MQSYLRKIFDNFKEYITLVCLLITSLILLSVNENPRVKQIRTYAFGTLSVVNAAVASALSVFSDQDRIIELKKENAELMLQLNKFRNYALENNELKGLLGLKDTMSYPLIPAMVVSKLTSKIQGNYIINAGRSDSVEIGMPLINEKGLVGIVDNTAKDFSVVRILQNSNLNIAVTNQRSNVNGILSWDGRELVIENIPTTFDMKVGDRVVTSSFSTIFPPSIPVGIIKRKETEVSGLLSKIYVEPFADTKSIRYLFVMKIIENNQIDSLELNLLDN